MALTLHKKYFEAMQDALTANQEDANPFIREGAKTFLRYDQMRVIQESVGLVAVEYLWRGVRTHTMHLRCDFAKGEMITLSGVEGKMEYRPSEA